MKRSIMAATLDATKKNAIATKLAEMKALQNLSISNQEALLQAIVSETEVRKILIKAIEEDRNSLAEIDLAIANLELFSQPSSTVKKIIARTNEMMDENNLCLYEKFMLHEGLKHQLVMIGLLIHKSVQASDGILQQAIDPLNRVNFRNRTHQEKLKSTIYFYGVRQLVGKEPETDLFAAVEDAIVSLKGAFEGLTE